MNIGVDIRCLMEKNRTGVGEYTYGLLNAVFSIDKINQYYLFYNSRKDVSACIPKWEQDNIHYINTRYSNKIFNLLLFLKLVKLDKIIKQKLDYWFSPNLNFINLSKNIKHFQTIHDLSFKFFPEFFTLKQRLWHRIINPKKQCRNAQMVITPSENTKRDVADEYQLINSKIQVLSPGALGENRIAGSRQKNNLSEKYILYLGTLEPRKNVEILLQAYKLLNTDYRLVAAGDAGWKNKKLLKLIKETPGVEYLGYVDENKKGELLKGALLLVFPSFYEGFGLPVLEAMGNGVPVITSNRASLPEVVGQAGCLINPYNVLELTGAMKRVLSDAGLRANMVEEGLQVAGQYNWQITAKKFLELL